MENSAKVIQFPNIFPTRALTDAEVGRVRAEFDRLREQGVESVNADVVIDFVLGMVFPDDVPDMTDGDNARLFVDIWRLTECRWAQEGHTDKLPIVLNVSWRIRDAE